MGENPQRSTDGLLSNNLGPSVHVFADLDNGLISDRLIHLQREEVLDGEAHESLQTGSIHLLGPEQPNATQPSEGTNASEERDIVSAGDLGPGLPMVATLSETEGVYCTYGQCFRTSTVTTKAFCTSKRLHVLRY